MRASTELRPFLAGAMGIEPTDDGGELVRLEAGDSSLC
jgi:uncharacterized cupin superfamily protein